MHRPLVAALHPRRIGTRDCAGGALTLERPTLDDGTAVDLRYLRPGDGPLIESVFAHLSLESRHARFLVLMKELSPQMLRALTDLDGRDHVAIVATSKVGDLERALGIARFSRSETDPELAEVALCVIDEKQRKGLGRILAVAIGRAALARGIHRFHGPILRDNDAVRSLLDEVGASFRMTEDGVEFEVRLDDTSHPARHPLDVLARHVLRAVTHAG